MSEETKIFRGDHAPEEGLVEKAIPVPNTPVHVPLTVPVPEAASAVPEPAPVTPAVPEAAAPAVPPPPPLDFRLDESQLFHTPEAVRQRMAQLASIAHSTAHMLDEQAQEAERIAQRLKKL